jgi:hypothetical protein
MAAGGALGSNMEVVPSVFQSYVNTAADQLMIV